MTFCPFRFIKLYILITICLDFSECHPQCIDSQAPFKVSGRLQFCLEYTSLEKSSFGCCTRKRDSDLKEHYGLISNSTDISPECKVYLKQLMCTECSPYAAHIYDSERSTHGRAFPGLCRQYCIDVYTKCKSIIPKLTNDTEILQSLASSDAFCSKVQLSDIDYCYPDLKTNPVLTNKTRDVQKNIDGCLCIEEFARGLSNPIFARTPMDGSERIFVGEQRGLVHIYYPNKTEVSKPFLDITKAPLLTSDSKGDERGFLGMAFHPRFKQNGRFFLYYSIKVSGQEYIRISSMVVSSAHPNKADSSSEKVILEIKEPAWNHNGGEILFGDDDYLYLFIGDGGKQGDPDGNGQNKNVLLAKVLRIDVNTGNTDKPYLIPADNPFVNEKGSRPEVYAYGVRNIWRCGKDRGHPITGEDKGRILCGDVGQDAWEEIDILHKGANYGWNSREGFKCFKKEICGAIGKEVLPIHAYGHADGKSVTGGHIYRGCKYPNLQGEYIYGDFMTGRIWRLKEDKTTNLWNNSEVFMCGPDKCLPGKGLLNKYEKYIISFGEDEEGELYFTTTSEAVTNNGQGKIYKLIDPTRREDPEICQKRKLQYQNKLNEVTTSATLHNTSSRTSVSTGLSRSKSSIWKIMLVMSLLQSANK